MYRSLASAAMLLAASIPAQAFYIPDDTPAEGSCNIVPFGFMQGLPLWENIRYQVAVAPAQLGDPSAPLPICGLGFASCGLDQTRRFGGITVRMAQLPGGALSATFEDNMVNNVETVLDAEDLVWWSIGNTWTDIGLDRPYTYVPGQGHLVIEIVTTGNDLVSGGLGYRSGGVARVWANDWTGTPPATGNVDDMGLKMRITSELAGAGRFGLGCGAGPMRMLYAGSSQLGRSFTCSLSDGPEGSPAVLIAGATRAPVDLTSLGAPGCVLAPALDVVLSAGTLGTGGLSQAVHFDVPNDPSALCCFVYVQGVALRSPANALGIETSDYFRIVAGN